MKERVSVKMRGGRRGRVRGPVLVRRIVPLSPSLSLSLPKGAPGEVEENGLQRGSLAREQARGQVERFGEGEERGKRVVGVRSEPLRAVDVGNLAVRRKARDQRSGGLRRGKRDFILERQAGEQLFECAEREDFAMVDDADARTEALSLLHIVR